jgi:GrpB-like predicted nucleotidyltransferase (UPF0157 family)
VLPSLAELGRAPLYEVTMTADDPELIGGPEERAVVIVDYDPAWPSRFHDHAASITGVLGPRALRVEHIGSTAVPGLAAKPIIDVLLVLVEPEREDTYLPALEAAGYVLRVREPSLDQHRMLRTPHLDTHVHVFPPHSREIIRYLVFRDLLRRDPGAREVYERTKRRLAQQDWPTMDHYAQGKTEVIEALITQTVS